MGQLRLNRVDRFLLTNTVLLIGMIAAVYFTAQWEYYVYLAMFFVVGGLVWRWVRRFDSVPIWILIALQIGILAHFAGGLVHFGPEGVRLYGHYFFGVRFDNYVHLYNAFAGASLLRWLFRMTGMKLGVAEPWIVIGCVLGAGAFIEIVEFIAVVTVPETGVGDYVNNMLDLVANLIGASTAAAFPGIRARLRGGRA